MDYNNFNPQPGYDQPAPAAQGGKPKALLFGILSIVIPAVGSVIESVSASSLTGHYFVMWDQVVRLIVFAVIFGILFSVAGIVLSVVATRMAGKHPTGKAVGGKVTGIIGRVESIIGVVCGVIILIAGLVFLGQF